MPRQANQIYYHVRCKSKKLMLVISETHNHQSAESLRAACFSKLDDMVNTNSIFNAKRAEFSAQW